MRTAKTPPHDGQTAELKVRTRSTVRPGLQVSRHETVHCPRRDASMSLRDCLLCVDCEGLRSNQDGILLRCRRSGDLLDRDDRPPVRGKPSAASRLRLSSVMTGDLVCVRPDVRLDALATLLDDRGFGGVPVVDDRGRPIGVVSKTDLVRATPEAGADTVADIMTPLTFSLPENATLSRAAAIMAYEGIHRVPVVAIDGTVVGIVTAMDVVRWLARHDGYAV